MKNRIRILAFVKYVYHSCISVSLLPVVAHVSFFLPFGIFHLFPLCCVVLCCDVLYCCVFLHFLEFRICFLLFFPRLFRYVFSVFAYVFACVMIYYFLLINAYLVCGCVCFFFCFCAVVVFFFVYHFYTRPIQGACLQRASARVKQHRVSHRAVSKTCLHLRSQVWPSLYPSVCLMVSVSPL